MSTLVKFTVYGKPQTRGSKTPFALRRKDGSPVTGKGGRPVIVTTDSNKKSGEWMNLVRDAARTAYSGELLTGPIAVGIRCYFVRPKSHYRSGKNAHLLGSNATVFPTPDFDKLTRAILDSLSKTVYRDDSQVCRWLPDNGKFWADDGSPERVEIEIARLTP